MATVSLLSQHKTRLPLSTLSKLTIVALAGNALALVYAQLVLVKGFDIGLTIFTGMMLLGAGLVAAGWRWTPLVGALIQGYRSESRQAPPSQENPPTSFIGECVALPYGKL